MGQTRPISYKPVRAGSDSLQYFVPTLPLGDSRSAITVDLSRFGSDQRRSAGAELARAGSRRQRELEAVGNSLRQSSR